MLINIVSVEHLD